MISALVKPPTRGSGRSAVRDCDSNHDFIGPRSVVDSHFHAVEVTADESRVLVAERDVENHAQSAALLRRRYQRSAFAQDFPHRRTQLGVENRRSVLEFAVLSDGGRFAIALDCGRGNAQRRDRTQREQLSQFLADQPSVRTSPQRTFPRRDSQSRRPRRRAAWAD